MEVILRDDIDKLGRQGKVVKVADGYARNYLLPKRLAVPATAANKKIVEQEREAYLRREASAISDASELAKLMEGLTLTIEHKAGEQEQLFGSVTAQNIVDALAAKNFTVDRRKVHLDQPIKQLGQHKVAIRLHREVTIIVGVKVVPEGGEEPPESDGEEATEPKVKAAPKAEAEAETAPEPEAETDEDADQETTE